MSKNSKYRRAINPCYQLISYVQGIIALNDLLMFSNCYITRGKIGTEAKFGGSVASVIWGEHPAIKTTTRIDISDRNHVVYA